MKNLVRLLAASLSILFLSACAAATPIPAAVKTELVATGQALSSPSAPTQAPPASGTAATPLPAVQTARSVLASQLHLQINQVKIVQVEAVDWPDGCLGVHTPGIMCNQMVTPGYKIVLEANGKSYEYHSNRDGSLIVLAVAPKPADQSPVITWQSGGSLCEQVDINSQGAAFGSCRGALVTVPFVDPGRAAELKYFTDTYQSFTGQTKTGSIIFKGNGSQPATPAVQRSIGEWARSIFMESQSGKSNRSQDLIIYWHREGGIAGFCDNLSIYTSGIAMASSCKGNQTQSSSQSFLNPDQLQQLYTWQDQYHSFSIKSQLPAAPDAMIVNFTFNGSGNQTLNSPGQQQPLFEFASRVYNQVRSAKPSTP
jgi:hypothetical protein